MKILITGIGGFVGSHMAEYLLNKGGNEVYGILRNKNNNQNLIEFENKLKIFECNILEFNNLSKIINDIRPEIIFHFAGQPFVPTSFDKTSETFEINVVGAINVFEAVKKTEKNTRIIITTSGEVYGEAFGTSLPTEKSLPHPVNHYAASKTAIDFISQTYKRYENLNIVIARPFNHTGPRQKNNFICSSLAFQIAKIKKQNLPKILNIGNIQMQRMFTDVRDMVKAYWHLSDIDNDKDFIFNITGEEIYSIENIIQYFEEIVNEKFELNIEEKRMRGYDIKLMGGDASLFKSKTNWKKEIPIEKTLNDLLLYWMDRV